MGTAMEWLMLVGDHGGDPTMPHRDDAGAAVGNAGSYTTTEARKGLQDRSLMPLPSPQRRAPILQRANYLPDEIFSQKAEYRRANQSTCPPQREGGRRNPPNRGQDCLAVTLQSTTRVRSRRQGS
jgi:hypothetical protein